jgi:hypothetical protein
VTVAKAAEQRVELGPGRKNKGRGRLESGEGGIKGPGLRVPVELEEEW